MMNMRSFKTVVLLFAKNFKHYGNFNAVIKTAEEYPHANIFTIRTMLETLRIIETNVDEIEYNCDRIEELLEFIENEQN